MANKETSTALSRTPTPTLDTQAPLDERSDIETPSTTNTDVSDEEDDEEDDDDDDDDDYVEHPPCFINKPLFKNLIDDLEAITKASIDPSVGTSTSDLTKYYSSKLRSISAKPDYATVPLTDPPCPHINLKIVDDSRYSDNCTISCPCCLPDDLPELKITAEDVDGGVITHGVMVDKLREWLYGNPDVDGGNGSESVTQQALPAIVDGLPGGESGLVTWNCMSFAGQTGKTDLGGLDLFLYFAKPLVGGGRHNSHRDDDHEGCGRQ
ncbi:hypothetical protein H072_3368 [Dactylellina haptotyla CBS 200.50]|uniref:Uncharacterized protein n=1 Tax=Dactylellina haptotyla (strain CBS 200.50) TaxID=1284197 RepID=S8AHU5_DACHA|nr:hypothetical protein H072_3368 [Dactylellina haptotyla CBS 200.50]